VITHRWSHEAVPNPPGTSHANDARRRDGTPTLAITAVEVLRHYSNPCLAVMPDL